MKALNLEGKRFGKLLVVEKIKIEQIIKNNKRTRYVWKCVCDCGGEINEYGYALNSNNRTSCGSCSRKELVGKTFGDLTIVSWAGLSKDRRNLFKCICSCGNEKIVLIKNLQRNSTTNCGCKSKKGQRYHKEFGESNFNSICGYYKRNAKKKGLNFCLSKKQLHDLFSKECYYCGVPPSRVGHKKNTYGDYIYNGIDRLDSSIGYIESNCVPCCTQCNYLKSNMKEKEFLKIIEKIYLHRIINKPI